MTSPSHGTRRRRPVLVPVAAALAAAGIGVTAALGGLKEAPPEKPPQLTPGQAIDQGQFRTEFLEAVDTTEQGSFGMTKRYLEIFIKVTNLGKETTRVGLLPKPGKISEMPLSFAGSLLSVNPEIKSKYGADVFVLSYGIESRQLHPGITTTVVVKYELEPTATAPAEIRVDVGRLFYGALGIRDRTHYWQLVGEDKDGEFTPTVAAQVSLPVRQEQA
ncbi:hypothetical protein ACFHYQ_20075 [Sphaerimonospora cavernae]|uniref:Tat pathway signal sequence domain protein n=1 Tax=Sphaerimonospora cavernae TaxID=1740611 RepID=A0ABV6U8Q8_9ACTN